MDKTTEANNTSSNTKRIAKNTLMLYFRQILIMLVSLYTVRVVLNVLGAEDYGIYNVVAGVVTMFSFLSGSLASSFQRYLTYDLAKNDSEKLKNTFALGLGVFVLLGVIILVLLETIGLLFVLKKLVIPQERLFAAVCVYEASVISFAILLMLAPFQAMLLADENMSVYAYASIIEVLLKLLIVILLKLFSFDKLTVYGFLMLLVPCANIVMYVGYCYRKYSATRTPPKFKWSEQKEIVSYTSWNLLGAMAGTVRNQGINILINLFFGPIVNAARGIANQVNSAIMSFSSNFSVALRPQIIKEYAVGNKDGSMKLVFRGCKFCFYLLWIFALPLILNMDYVLTIWLKNVPEYAVLFTILVIIDGLVDCLSYPLIALMHAHGRIKEYQIIVGIIQLLNLPVSYIFLKLGYPASSTMFIAIVLSVLAIISRLIVLHILTKVSILAFLRNVIISVVLVLGFSLSVSYAFNKFCIVKLNFGFFVLESFISVIVVIASILIWGITREERSSLLYKIKSKITITN